MVSVIVSILEPDFYKEFHCVAGACRNSCCVYPWNISIDKANYKKLRDLKQPKWLTDNLGQYIKRTPDNKPEEYAQVVFKEHGCAFQTEEGLCRLQAELGEGYLSHTCRTYPRLASFMKGDINYRECCLSTSCEEVARMLLHKQEPILFESRTEKLPLATFQANMFTYSNMLHQEDRPILTHYHLIRSICIAVLQNREYSIEQRLALLMIYLDKLAAAEQNETTNDIPHLTDVFVSAVDEHLYDSLFEQKTGAKPAVVLGNIASVYAFGKCTNDAIIKRCDAGIANIPYPQRMENYYRFISDKEYFLEHLLVNELFGDCLPFKTGYSILENAQFLASIFSILRFMLGGYIGNNNTLTEVEILDFISFFGKTVLHSSASFTNNIDLLKRADMNTLPALITLILG
ncbi:MAG: flagellin lysine-N-methylase [Angelakisella sp.]